LSIATHLLLGQSYRLSQAALELRTFTVSELGALTHISENTIYSFLSRLGDENLNSRNLTAQGRGRPRKRYWLTEAGTVLLLQQASQTLAVLNQEVSTRGAPELIREILSLPESEREALVTLIAESIPPKAAESVQTPQKEAAGKAAAVALPELAMES